MEVELSGEERNWAMAAHLCGLLWLAGGTGLLFLPFGGLVLFTILGPLIIWLTKGRTMPFVAEPAKESLNFQITVLLLWLLGLVNLILVIVAAVQVGNGRPYRYPFCLRLVK
jgi:uncharacterized Tic20 family protein